MRTLQKAIGKSRSKSGLRNRISDSYICKADKSDIDNISDIHIGALNNDFLPQLGKGFLRELYSGLLEDEETICLVHKSSINKKKVEISGFVVGSTNTREMFSKVYSKKKIKLFFAVIKRLITKPSLIFKVIETMRYPKKMDCSKLEAELVIIAVNKDYQGQGIGRKLCHELNKWFRKKDIYEYKVTTYSDKNANKFYKKTGFKKICSITLNNKKANVYKFKITK